MKFLCFPVFALTATLSFAAFGQDQPEPPKTPTPDAAAPTTQPKTGVLVGQPVDPNKYVLGPEDIIRVQTWREPDFSMLTAVRPDGKITMPLIGDVQAAGLTPMALTGDLKGKIGQYVQHPDVTVIVEAVKSKKYYIDGEVGKPGQYPLVTPTRVLEALSMAGGFREFADEKHIKILRGTQAFNFNYREVIKGKHLDQDIYLENGDHIIVR